MTPIDDNPVELLLCTSYHHLFLLDAQLHTLAQLPHVLSDGLPIEHAIVRTPALRPRPAVCPAPPIPCAVQGLERLSLMEYVAEMSLVVLGGQTSTVAVVRIERCVGYR